MENESLYTLSEDELVRSPQSSPAARFHAESPSSEYSDIHHGKSSEADAETHRYRLFLFCFYGNVRTSNSFF